MGFRTESMVYATGANFDGQLGLGDTDTRFSPAAVTLTGVAGVFAGGDSTCLTTSSGMYGVGSNRLGQLALGNSTPNAIMPQSLPSTLLSASPADFHTMFVGSVGSGNDLGIYGVGVNSYGQLGSAAAGPVYDPLLSKVYIAPTLAPTPAPTPAPTFLPTAAPTVAPSSAPTGAPTPVTTAGPTEPPTTEPGRAPNSGGEQDPYADLRRAVAIWVGAIVVAGVVLCCTVARAKPIPQQDNEAPNALELMRAEVSI